MDLRCFHQYEVPRRRGKKVEEWYPGRLSLKLVQSLERHANLQYVIGLEGDRLAPMAIKQLLVVERMNAPMRLRNASSEFAFIKPSTLPKNAGSS